MTVARPKLLNVSEAAARLGCSARTVRRLARTGALPPIRFGSERGHLRFELADVEAFIRRSRRDSEAVA